MYPSKAAGDQRTPEKEFVAPDAKGTEEEQLGAIRCSLYVHLFKMAGPIFATLLVLIFGFLAIACQVASDKILAYWFELTPPILRKKHLFAL